MTPSRLFQFLVISVSRRGNAYHQGNVVRTLGFSLWRECRVGWYGEAEEVHYERHRARQGQTRGGVLWKNPKSQILNLKQIQMSEIQNPKRKKM
jgi:hypothetical protein